MPQNADWLEKFVGRAPELQQLHEAYRNAKNGKPQFLVFLAETGWGKTRLVQQFYEELVSAEDSKGYWPSSIVASDDLVSSRRLTINPKSLSREPGLGPPFLWIGVSFAGAKGTGQAGLLQVEPRLRPHIAPLIGKWNLATMTEQDKERLKDL